MLHFRTRREAEETDLAEEIREVVLSRIDAFEDTLKKMGYAWYFEDDGWFSLLESAEVLEPLRAMGWEQRLDELLFEAVHYHAEAKLWECIYIPGNNWGWTAFIPDSPDLPHALRERFVRETSNEDADLARRDRQ